MHSSKSMGFFLIRLIAIFNYFPPQFGFSLAERRSLGFWVNKAPNLSLAHSTQWRLSSGNILRVHWGISPSSWGSLVLS